MTRLSDLTLDFLSNSREDGNYVSPFVRNITTLCKVTVRNSMLNQETMRALSNNGNMKYMNLENVTVVQRFYFRNMLTKLRNIKTFIFIHLQFSCLTNIMGTVEAIIDIIPSMPELNGLKISVWQELGMSYLRHTEHYERVSNTFRLSRGNSIPFLRSLIPLVSSLRISDFELFYINDYMPETSLERTLLKYKIIDNETYNVKHYTYLTE